MKKLLLALFASAFLLSIAACGTPECAETEDCGNLDVCTSGKCVPAPKCGDRICTRGLEVCKGNECIIE